MVRAACCEKKSVNKGPWSAEEDRILISYICNFGHGNWRALPKLAGLKRCGKSCRLRWVNYLRPDIKRGNFTKEEEDTIIDLHKTFGNKWSAIAARLPGRTDNEIKNVWHTHIKKKLVDPSTTAAAASSSSSSSSSSSKLKTKMNKTTKDASMGSASSHTASTNTQLSHASDSVSTPDSASVVSGDQLIIINNSNGDADEGAKERSFGSLEEILPEIDEAGVFSWLDEDDDGKALPMDFTALDIPSSPLMVNRLSSSHSSDDMDFWLQVFLGSTGEDQLMEQPHIS